MVIATQSGRTGNRLLDRLPEEEYDLLVQALERVSLPHGYEIYRPNDPMPYVYFPQHGICSSIVVVEEGRTIETGAVGNEGMLSTAVYLGLDFSPIRSVTQVPGDALRLPSDRFVQAIRPGGTLDHLLKRYTAFSLRFASQSVACNTMHSVEERMGKWLLMVHDSAGQDEYFLTHEYLSEMLGTRRQTVTVIAGTLQRAGLITYRRGMMRILDREGLQEASCECYGIMTALYDRILNGGA
jgi:CRP-like cAMP-binding protein